MTQLSMATDSPHIHPPSGVVQVGWLGQSGRVWRLDEQVIEPGSFTPLYIEYGEECSHMLAPPVDDEALVDEAIAAGDEAEIEVEPGHHVGSIRDL